MIAMTPTAVREAPREGVLSREPHDPAFPNVGDHNKPQFEQKLALDIIQGNVIDGGFNKDFQTVLCLEIVDTTRAQTLDLVYVRTLHRYSSLEVSTVNG